MDNQVLQIAERIRGLRDISDISVAEMAKRCEVSEEEYVAFEAGKVDFSFTFLYKCAAAFGVELTDAQIETIFAPTADAAAGFNY